MPEFLNREISWLSFNERVLQEANDPSVPLCERIRFLGIFSNNLDEFFRVRVATVKRMVDLGKDENSLLGNYNPKDLLEEIQNIVCDHQKSFRRIYSNILSELREENIFVINENELSDAQGVFVRNYFKKEVLPNLVPLMVSHTAKFPYLRDRSIYLAIQLGRYENNVDPIYSLIRVPRRSVPRFIVLPEQDGKKYVMILDDVIRYCLEDIFTIFNYDYAEAYTIKITRDAELDIDDDISKSFIEKMSIGLKKRKRGAPVRMIYDEKIPKELLDFICKKMKIDKRDNIIAGSRYHNNRDLMNFPEIGAAHHYYTKQPPLSSSSFKEHTSLFKAIRKKDVILHYPYQSFDYFIDLLREAAIDPDVCQIGITLYRVASDSKVVNALLNASRNGKKVTVVIELQARFDEENNIFWSNKLQEEGVTVIHGVSGLKVHSKLAWISRWVKGEVRNYAYIGTGNFHEGTARVYADEGLFTADKRIADEVAHVFEFFHHNYKQVNYHNLLVSPFNLRDRFDKLVEQEIVNKQNGKDAWIFLKLNSLVDEAMIRKLYKASNAGVNIRLIIRGICCLVPGIKGQSENIEAISIVDKYLEHSRILMFCHGGEEKMFIGSADWMPRNLNRRIEVAVPIYDAKIREELRKQLEIQWCDNQKARVIEEQLSNNYRLGTYNEPLRSQYEYYNYLKEFHSVY